MSQTAAGADPQALVEEAEELRARSELVSRQLEMLSGLREDKLRAHHTLQGIQGGATGGEMLVPVGGNTFVYATLADTAKVLKGIGAEYAMPRGIDTAIAELKTEMDALESEIGQLARAAGQIEARHQQVVEALQAMGAMLPPES